MIINTSRALTYEACPRKALNQDIRRLATRARRPLAVGTIFHKAVARGLASQDWKTAKELVLHEGPEILAPTILPEDEPHVGAILLDIVYMVNQYEEAYKEQELEIIQPECEFDVPIPGSEHNCITLHHMHADYGGSFWGMPSPEDILAGKILPAHRTPEPDCKCWVPHRLKGKADALVRWNKWIWLMDHKTAARTGTIWWMQWHLAKQLTAYLYGIQQAVGITPRGIIINAIVKPTDDMVEAYNKRRKYGTPKTANDYLAYERQLFMRSDEDLARFSRDLTHQCNEYEGRIISGYWPMNSGSCTSYNSICDFHEGCVQHEPQSWLDAMLTKEPDYVDEARAAQLIQITK